MVEEMSEYVFENSLNVQVLLQSLLWHFSRFPFLSQYAMQLIVTGSINAIVLSFLLSYSCFTKHIWW